MPDTVNLTMDAQSADTNLKVMPVQVIETDDGVILSRGSVQFKIAGVGSFDVVHDLLTQLQPPGATRAKVINAFAGPAQPKLVRLLDMLIERRLVTASETYPPSQSGDTAEDVFFWEFGLSADEIRNQFAQQDIHVVGVNRIGLALISALKQSGFDKATLIDAPLLRNMSLFEEDGFLKADTLLKGDKPPVPEAIWTKRVENGALPGLLVVTSEFGGMNLLRPWNEWTVGHGVSFLPIVLQHLVGTIGPVVVPHETACYECVRGRENSNMEDPKLHRQLEAMAFEGQFAMGHHPLVPRMVADHAAFELTKIFSGIGKGPIGRMITVSPLDCLVTTHRILKLPFCPVCGVNADHAQPALGDIAG